MQNGDGFLCNRKPRPLRIEDVLLPKFLHCQFDWEKAEEIACITLVRYPLNLATNFYAADIVERFFESHDCLITMFGFTYVYVPLCHWLKD